MSETTKRMGDGDVLAAIDLVESHQADAPDVCRRGLGGFEEASARDLLGDLVAAARAWRGRTEAERLADEVATSYRRLDPVEWVAPLLSALRIWQETAPLPAPLVGVEAALKDHLGPYDRGW
jgi:hypothetical protein